MEAEKVAELAESMKDVDPTRFVHVERFADPDVQMFERHTPVKLNGAPDPNRKIRYFSSVMVNYKGNQYSEKFEIKAESLDEAVKSFRIAAASAGGALLEQLENADAARHLLMTDGVGSKN